MATQELDSLRKDLRRRLTNAAKKPGNSNPEVLGLLASGSMNVVIDPNKSIHEVIADISLPDGHIEQVIPTPYHDFINQSEKVLSGVWNTNVTVEVGSAGGEGVANRLRAFISLAGMLIRD